MKENISLVCPTCKQEIYNVCQASEIRSKICYWLDFLAHCEHCEGSTKRTHFAGVGMSNG